MMLPKSMKIPLDDIVVSEYEWKYNPYVRHDLLYPIHYDTSISKKPVSISDYDNILKLHSHLQNPLRLELSDPNVRLNLMYITKYPYGSDRRKLEIFNVATKLHTTQQKIKNLMLESSTSKYKTKLDDSDYNKKMLSNQMPDYISTEDRKKKPSKKLKRKSCSCKKK